MSAVTCRLDAVCLDALDPAALAGFWTQLLGWPTAAEPGGGVVLVPDDDTGFRLRLTPTDVPKSRQNRAHLDLTSATLADQERTVAHAIDLGGRHAEVGQTAEEQHVVLADPEGNEFCVIEPGNSFLAGCGFIGALACDGSQRVGHFWSAALAWPLVWDRDEETAIRSPHGGPKISWGGPPVSPRVGRDRVRFDLAPVDTDQATEAARLVALGATTLGSAPDAHGAIVLADPDGTEFRLLAAA